MSNEQAQIAFLDSWFFFNNLNFQFITFTLVKRIEIAFFLRSYFFGFSQSFRIFVTLLYVIGKKVIFLKFSDFW